MNSFFLKALCGLVLVPSMTFGFEFRRAAEHMEEAGTIVVCILEEPKAHYAFRPPFNWDTIYDEHSKTVTMAPKKDPKSWITIRVASSTNSPGAGVKAYVQSAYKCAVEDQFTLHTASKEAAAADFMDPSAGGIPLKRRVALVNSPSGTFEFLLSSRPDDFGPGDRAFGQLMASFEFRGPPQRTAPAAAH